MKIIIKGGLVVDPASSLSQIQDLYIEDRQIVTALSGPADQVIDATGMAVLPAA